MLRDRPMMPPTWTAILLVFAMLMPAATAQAAQATLDAAGYVRVDGAPFFPIGIYHVSWIGDRQGRLAVPDLHAIADAGFKTGR